MLEPCRARKRAGLGRFVMGRSHGLRHFAGLRAACMTANTEIISRSQIKNIP